MLRMAPTHERLHFLDVSARQVDDRLIVDLQLTLVQGAPQLGFELQTSDCNRIEAWVEDDRLRATTRLGAVQSDIRVTHQVARRVPSGRTDGDAHAGRCKD